MLPSPPLKNVAVCLWTPSGMSQSVSGPSLRDVPVRFGILPPGVVQCVSETSPQESFNVFQCVSGTSPQECFDVFRVSEARRASLTSSLFMSEILGPGT